MGYSHQGMPVVPSEVANTGWPRRSISTESQSEAAVPGSHTMLNPSSVS